MVNAYMPTRSRETPDYAAKVATCREALEAAAEAAARDGIPLAIGGDLQARTAWALATERETATSNVHDACLARYTSEHCLTSAGDVEMTYAAGGDRPMTAIDHWLLSTEVLLEGFAGLGCHLRDERGRGEDHAGSQQNTATICRIWHGCHHGRMQAHGRAALQLCRHAHGWSGGIGSAGHKVHGPAQAGCSQLCGSSANRLE